MGALFCSSSIHSSNKMQQHQPSPASKESFVYVKENPVDENLQCLICVEPLLDPVIEPACRQMFCKACLELCLRDVDSCPYCRQPTSISSVSLPPRYISNMLDALLVVCPTCQGQFERSKLKEHHLKCPICTLL